MEKKQDRNTRYFIDVDLKEQKILGWDFDQKEKLLLDKISEPYLHRVFITKGQYNKLDKKQEDVLESDYL